MIRILKLAGRSIESGKLYRFAWRHENFEVLFVGRWTGEFDTQCRMRLKDFADREVLYISPRRITRIDDCRTS